MLGCTSQSKQNKNQKIIVERDTAYMIEPFLKDGITYICKDKIIKSYLVDYNYSPPQEFELNQVTAKIKGNTVIVGTDCYITHTIQSGTYWKIEKLGNTYSSPQTKLAILKTDKGEIRIAEVEGVLTDFCVLEIKYGNYKTSPGYPCSYYRLPQEMFPQHEK